MTTSMQVHSELPYMGWTSAQRAQRLAEARRSRDEAQKAAPYSQSGMIDFRGTGEGLFTLTFKYVYVHKPVFTYGCELGENQGLVKGSYPTMTALVADWVTRPAGRSTLYEGAKVAVVVTGPTTPPLRLYLHYVFNGTAMTPTGNSTSAYNALGTA